MSVCIALYAVSLSFITERMKVFAALYSYTVSVKLDHINKRDLIVSHFFVVAPQSPQSIAFHIWPITKSVKSCTFVSDDLVFVSTWCYCTCTVAIIIIINIYNIATKW